MSEGSLLPILASEEGKDKIASAFRIREAIRMG